MKRIQREGTKKERIDMLLVKRGLTSSRARAQALIMSGKVLVEGLRVDKPGREFAPDADVVVKQGIPYVSRGGLKLKAALEAFRRNPSGLSLLDGGASTGGFTDCLLELGAARIVAVDVGYGQLDWSLRNDPRVTVLERTNIRYLKRGDLPYPVDGAVLDLSFISLKLVLPQVRLILPAAGWLIPLVKPQFEVGRNDVGKGGVVRDAEKIREAVEGIKRCAEQSGFQVLGEVESPVRGPKGNREFFLHLEAV